MKQIFCVLMIVLCIMVQDCEKIDNTVITAISINSIDKNGKVHIIISRKRFPRCPTTFKGEL